MTLIHNQQQRLINFQDGRRLPNDDLRAIQRQLDNLSMLFAGWGAFVLTGCEVTVNSNNNSLRDVAEGLVYLNDHLIYFPGVTGLDLSSSQYMVEISSLQLAPRGYVLSGTTEEGLMEYRVDFASSKPGSGEYVEFRESGAQRTKASDLDLPQAVVDIANLQSNKADKVTSPVDPVKPVNSFPGYNSPWQDGNNHPLLYKEDQERKRVYLSGSFTYEGEIAATNSLISTLDIALATSPLFYGPHYFPVYNENKLKWFPCYLENNGELWLEVISTTDPGDNFNVPFREFLID